MTFHGFLNVDKPAGMTSHDVVTKIRRLAGQKRVGHGGTLDPAATGILPIALGEATKLVSYLVDGRKAYQATIRLGATTTTDDAEGVVREARPVPELSTAQIEAVLQPFIGCIAQIPPMYSAIQVGGQRMYDLARRGETVELAPRMVEIDSITLRNWQAPDLILDVVCGKGTYIRALARDLGAALGCGAHLASLRRTQVGPLNLLTAVPLTSLITDPDQLKQHVLPPETAIVDWPRVDVDVDTTQRIRHGLPIPLGITGELARIHGPDGALLALVRRADDEWQPFRVFAWA